MTKKKSAVSKRIDASPYHRGGFWLEKHRGGDNWYVYWYNKEKRQYEYKSTRTDELFDATYLLNKHYLEVNGRPDTFCGYCGQKMADGGTYSLIQAIDDYLIEVAEKRASQEAIVSRINHIIRFADLGMGRPDLPCAEAVHDQFVERFRDWLEPQPIVWRNGLGEVTQTAVRTKSSVEESVHQLRAVLNHAVRKGRSDAKPVFQAFSRQVVSDPVRARASIQTLAEMVDYAAEYDKRAGLHRFIVASLCTAARPDAIYDMSVRPDRFQWQKSERLFDLNPRRRVQTKKYRPMIPVVQLLHELLEDAERDGPDGWVIHSFGKPVTNIRNAWRKMIADLGLPGGREWGSYLMRRSIATLLRQRQASPWDVQGILGHRIAKSTEIYAYSSFAPTAREGIEDILSEIERIVPGKLQGKCRVKVGEAG